MSDKYVEVQHVHIIIPITTFDVSRVLGSVICVTPRVTYGTSETGGGGGGGAQPPMEFKGFSSPLCSNLSLKLKPLSYTATPLVISSNDPLSLCCNFFGLKFIGMQKIKSKTSHVYDELYSNSQN